MTLRKSELERLIAAFLFGLIIAEERNAEGFEGWHEGSISFAPTYKYEINSHEYSGQNAKAGEKRRTPAW